MADVGTESGMAARIIAADARHSARWERVKAHSNRSVRQRFFGGAPSFERTKSFIGPRQPGPPGAFSRGATKFGKEFASLSGFDYFEAAAGHYSSMRSTGPVYSRTGLGLSPRGGIGPSIPAGTGLGMRTMGGRLARRAVSAGRVVGKAVIPGIGIYFGAERGEREGYGAGIGIAAEMTGFLAFGQGAEFGLAAGGWFGGAGVRAAKRIPMVGSLMGETTLAVGSGLAAGLGYLIGGMIAFEAAAWSVGFTLHTLPTFAKQFQKDMGRSGFGGDFIDSAGAATVRQRSLQVMGKSFANARSALGQEASLLHA